LVEDFDREAGRKLLKFARNRRKLEAHLEAVNKNWRIIVKIGGKILSENCASMM